MSLRAIGNRLSHAWLKSRRVGQDAAAKAKAAAAKAAGHVQMAAFVILPMIGLAGAAVAANRFDARHSKQLPFGHEMHYELLPGTTICSQGEEQHVVGYFGAEKQTMSKLDPSRDLYYGHPTAKGFRIAAGYAYSHSKHKDDVPAVAIIVGKGPADATHHGHSRYDNQFHPLSPRGQAELGTRVLAVIQLPKG